MNIEPVCDGLQFPEGPVAMADGSVLVVEMRRETLTRVHPDGTIEIVAELGGSPNGAAIGPDGHVYICNSGGLEWHEDNGKFSPGHKPAGYVSGSLQRVDPNTGAFSTLYTSCDGSPLSGPNDLVFDREGGIWFTDMGRTTDEHKEHGAIYYAQPDGCAIERVIMLPNIVGAPNGIGLSRDERTLFVADTFTARLWAFDVASPGKLASASAGELPGRGRVFGNLPGLQLIDSLALDETGAVCVATIFNGGITVFSGGNDPEHFPFPDIMVTNICFGRADMRTAWITGGDSGRLFRCRWPIAGQRLNFNA